MVAELFVEQFKEVVMKIRNFAKGFDVEINHQLEGRLCWDHQKNVIGLILNVDTEFEPPALDIFWTDGDYTKEELISDLGYELIKFNYGES